MLALFPARDPAKIERVNPLPSLFTCVWLSLSHCRKTQLALAGPPRHRTCALGLVRTRRDSHGSYGTCCSCCTALRIASRLANEFVQLVHESKSSSTTLNVWLVARRGRGCTRRVPTSAAARTAHSELALARTRTLERYTPRLRRRPALQRLSDLHGGKSRDFEASPTALLGLGTHHQVLHSSFSRSPERKRVFCAPTQEPPRVKADSSECCFGFSPKKRREVQQLHRETASTSPRGRRCRGSESLECFPYRIG